MSKPIMYFIPINMSLFSPRFEEEEQKEDDKLSTEEIDDEVSLPLDMALSEDESEDGRKKNLKQKDDAAPSGDNGSFRNRYDDMFQ